MSMLVNEEQVKNIEFNFWVFETSNFVRSIASNERQCENKFDISVTLEVLKLNPKINIL